MSFSGTIIHVKKGFVAPEAFLRMALAKNPTCVTVSCIDGKNFLTEGDMNPSLAGIMEAQTLAKDFDTVIHMSNYPKDFPEDSAQPFWLFENKDNQPEALLYLDGDFSNYHETKSSHSPDFFAFQKNFKLRMEKWYNRGGLAGVKEELKDVTTKHDIQNSFLGRGNVVVFLLSGELFHIQKGNEDFKQYPWGYATNAYGFKEEEPKPAPTSVPSTGKLNDPARRFNIKRAGASAPIVKPTEGEPAKEASKSIKEAADKVDPPVKQETKHPEGGTKVEAQPGETMIEISWKPTFPMKATREQKQGAYNACEFITDWRTANAPKNYPDGYKNGNPLKLMVPQSKLADYIAMGAKPTSQLGEQLQKQQQQPPKQTNLSNKQIENNRANKDTAPHHVAAPPKASDSNKHSTQPVEDDVAGYKPFSGDTMSKHAPSNPEVAEWFVEAFKNPKFVDVASQQIALDPKTIQGLENQIEDATAAAGLGGLEDTFRLSRPALVNLCKLHPEWFVDLFVQVRHAYIKTLKVDERPKPSEAPVEEKPKAQANGKNRFKFNRAA